MATTSTKHSSPLLLFLAMPVDGHIGPLSRIMKALVSRGYDAVFLAPQHFQDQITLAGAEVILAEPWQPPAEVFALQLPPGQERVVAQLKYLFYQDLPNKFAQLTKVLETLKARDPQRQIIIVEDNMYMATHPFSHGAPLPKGFSSWPKRIGISTSIYVKQSIDHGPFGSALPRDSTESGRLRNQLINQMALEGPWKPLINLRRDVLQQCGSTDLPGLDADPMEALFTSYDLAVMLCSPSMEFDISDRPPTVRFAGCLPPKEASPDLVLPSWWNELQHNATLPVGQRKSVVFVSQGTVSPNLHERIAPTIQALDCPDKYLVIVTLGRTGAEVPGDLAIPDHVRVVDYIPYDVILPFTNVFVTFAGYGAISHAVMNGVPAVVAGMNEDKGDVVMRAKYSGFAYGLHTQTPSVDMIREGVNAVLGDDKYKKRALELKKENVEMDCLGRIHDMVVRLTTVGTD